MHSFLFSLVHLIEKLRPAIEILAILVSSVFVVSGITDTILDLYYFWRSIRRFFLSRKWPRITLNRLLAREQQKIAICIACWHEADVIAHTLTNAINNIQYRNYDIFVGTYPNDPETQYQVDQIAMNNPRVHKVIYPFPGPTTKPSNLNNIYQAIRDREKNTGLFYEIIMIQDSEDFIHPYSLLVVNYIIPRKDMVQLPVFPWEVPLLEFTHWSYADEFAENHTKLLLVRELTGGFVPAAGVGAAFTRRSFEWFNAKQIQTFSTNTLTEDYELGLRMHLEGFKAAFVQVQLPVPDNFENKDNKSMQWVATRSYFPRNFWQAVRQKTRWNIGIVLQAWKNIGWRGDKSIRWNLFLDRKTLISTPANFLAYIVFIYFLLYEFLRRNFIQYLQPLLIEGTLLWYLVVIATFFMVWRLLNRAYAVNKIYGFWPAVVSVPRSVWGNAINFFAIVRAVVQYTNSQLKNKKITWDKTTHQARISRNNFHRETNTEVKTTGEEDSVRKKKQEVDTVIKRFLIEIQAKEEEKRVKAIRSIDKNYGKLLFPYLKQLIRDPSWQVRAAVCATLSFLRLPESLPLLKKVASDTDWVVRSNATRAIGKMGDKGEKVLLSIVKGKDRYAREAALAILEQQGFLDRYIEMLKSNNLEEVRIAVRFLKILEKYGHSRLAKIALEKL